MSACKSQQSPSVRKPPAKYLDFNSDDSDSDESNSYLSMVIPIQQNPRKRARCTSTTSIPNKRRRICETISDTSSITTIEPTATPTVSTASTVSSIRPRQTQTQTETYSKSPSPPKTVMKSYLHKAANNIEKLTENNIQLKKRNKKLENKLKQMEKEKHNKNMSKKKGKKKKKCDKCKVFTNILIHLNKQSIEDNGYTFEWVHIIKSSMILFIDLKMVKIGNIFRKFEVKEGNKYKFEINEKYKFVKTKRIGIKGTEYEIYDYNKDIDNSNDKLSKFVIYTNEGSSQGWQMAREYPKYDGQQIHLKGIIYYEK